MQGCFRNLLASVGCLTVLAVGGVVAWQSRAQLAGLYRSVTGGATRADPPENTADPPSPVGRPSDAALGSARAKEADMARSNGPPLVVLTAAEMAALISDGLDPAARAALDSVEVTLMDDRFALRAQLLTELLGGQLGPVGGLLDRREPLLVSGPARVAGVGVVAWEPDSFTVRAFPFPRSAIPVLVNRLTGGSDGTVQIGVPPTVGDLRIRPSGVTFYRRVSQ